MNDHSIKRLGDFKHFVKFFCHETPNLAISLLFGLALSTLLTVLVIPAIHVVLRNVDRTT